MYSAIAGAKVKIVRSSQFGVNGFWFLVSCLVFGFYLFRISSFVFRIFIPRMSYSSTEENYIKAIFHLSEDGDENISTNDIAKQVNATAASVTDMPKKLKQKKIIT